MDCAGLLCVRGADDLSDHFRGHHDVHEFETEVAVPRGRKRLLAAERRDEGAFLSSPAVCFSLHSSDMCVSIVQGNLAKLPKAFGGEAADGQSSWLANEVKTVFGAAAGKAEASEAVKDAAAPASASAKKT